MKTPLSPEVFEQTIRQTLPILKPHAFPADLKETLKLIFRSKDKVVDRERFNIILSSFHLPPTRAAFFRHYFGDKIEDAESLKASLLRLAKDCLWHFGDIRRGYLILNESDDIAGFIASHQFNVAEFRDRLEWAVIEDIPPSDRGYLGYVSGERPYQQRKLLSIADKVIHELEQNAQEYAALNASEVTSRILKKLADKEREQLMGGMKELHDLELFESVSLEKNKAELARLRKEVDETIKKVELLKETAKRNQMHYLRNVEMIDVYVATSMRDDKEYLEMYSFVDATFSDHDIRPLNLRYFDPTLCYCDSRIDKGIIECLLVRCAKVTIYCAQDGDTFGKDSELAATLCQGKPVIVFVPTENNDLERKRKLEKRAQTFREFHPLGLQVGLYDGVARGVIVVRSPQECARMLKRILTNSLEVEFTFEQHGIVLREKETQSVLRVMTGWRELASSFWHNFGISEDPKSGRPS
ncbi:MAG: hypothetical protein HZA32_05715 [Opitutae bacterium]|nr:hypothetical protein [Opitutae bacterium]